MGSFPWLISGWATATAGGLFLFLFLAPRRRQPQPLAAEVGPIEALNPEPAPVATASETEAGAVDAVLPEEANLPRWLRPSVQAARRGQRVRSAKPRDEDS